MIANAAINPSGEHFKDTDPEDMEAAWRVNVGVLYSWSLQYDHRVDKFILPRFLVL